MKNFKNIFTIIILTFVCTACGTKTQETPTISIGESYLFTKEEISNAIDCVIENFDFPACTLEKVWYDENESENFDVGYTPTGTSEENIIVLFSNFYVDKSGDNPVLTPGMLYENYSWVLVRDDKNDDWEILYYGL